MSPLSYFIHQFCHFSDVQLTHTLLDMFIFGGANVNEIMFLIANSAYLLMVYGKAFDYISLVSYPTSLL